MEISAESMAEAVLQATATDEFDLGKGHVLLRPPIKHSTRKIAMGATTHLLRKQHKLLRNETLREQPINCQWKKHRGAPIPPDELWRNKLKILEAKEMAPQGLALTHEAVELLYDWENFGCPTKWARRDDQRNPSSHQPRTTQVRART